MENTAHHLQDPPLYEPMKKDIAYLLFTKYRLFTYGILGGVFFLLYTGGFYYFLFADKENNSQKKPYPTPFSATATPAIPTPTAVPTPLITPANMTQWGSYTNETYGIRIGYPSSLRLSVNKTAVGVDPYRMVLSYRSGDNDRTVTIDVQDPIYIGQSDVESRTIAEMNLSEFSAKKWSLNDTYIDTSVATRRVGSLTPTTLFEVKAFMLTVAGSYYDDRTYLTLAEEYTYVFLQHKGYNMIISYPTADPLLQQIVTNLTFL